MNLNQVKRGRHKNNDTIVAIFDLPGHEGGPRNFLIRIDLLDKYGQVLNYWETFRAWSEQEVDLLLGEIQ